MSRRILPRRIMPAAVVAAAAMIALFGAMIALSGRAFSQAVPNRTVEILQMQFNSTKTQPPPAPIGGDEASTIYSKFIGAAPGGATPVAPPAIPLQPVNPLLP